MNSFHLLNMQYPKKSNVSFYYILNIHLKLFTLHIKTHFMFSFNQEVCIYNFVFQILSEQY